MIARVLRSVTASLLIALSAAACSTIEHAYDGPTLPKEKVAFVTGYNEQGVGRMIGLYIVAVDGKAFPHVNEYPYAVYLKPGPHALTVQFWNASFGRAKLFVQDQLITVDPGRTYVIKHTSDPPLEKIWIEDEQGVTISTAAAPSVMPTLYGWKKQ